MIAMLLLIRERVGRPARQIQIGEDMDILAAGGAERLAMTRFFDRVRRAIMSGATVGEFVRPLVLDFVIRQHERVAMSKLPDDTFRFRRDGDRLRFSTLRAEAGFNDSRFTAVSHDRRRAGPGRRAAVSRSCVTPAGTSLLTAGDLPERPLTGASDPGEQT